MTTSPLKVVIPVVAIVVGVTVGLFAVKHFVARERQGRGGIELQEGGVVPDLKLYRFGGGAAPLSSLSAKVVLVNFWATWCPGCLSEMPSIIALRKAYVEKGFEVIALNVDENPEAVLPGFLKKMGIDFPVYVDRDGEASRVFDVHGIPLSLLIDMKARKILMVESGERDWNSEEIHTRLEEWLAQ